MDVLRDLFRTDGREEELQDELESSGKLHVRR
jgi:hypothetical protein